MQEQRGVWIREPSSDTTIVFVHGILSSGEECWGEGDSYWPKLLASEPESSETGIYVFSYRSTVLSGTYSIGDAVDALHAYLKLDGVLDAQNVIFVAHSMGGIVVRRFIVKHQAFLIERAARLGLFLVASPSLGSQYANLLSALAKFFKHTQAVALRFADDNTWLNDLDRDFINLKESGRLAIYGQELVEDLFIVKRSLIRTQIVQAFSGSRYFGDSIKIPGSDHFSISKPSNTAALQHRLLTSFIKTFLAATRHEIPPSARTRIRVRVLEPSIDARQLEFTDTHVTIGRGPENQVVIPDPQVSWEHGLLAFERGILVYRHLSRTNPTLLRGRGREVRLAQGGVQEVALASEDRLDIGDVVLSVEFTPAATSGYITTASAAEE